MVSFFRAIVSSMGGVSGQANNRCQGPNPAPMEFGLYISHQLSSGETNILGNSCLSNIGKALVLEFSSLTLQQNSRRAARMVERLSVYQ